VIAVTTFTIMTTWQRGSTIVTRERETAEGAAAGIRRPNCRGGVGYCASLARRSFSSRGDKTAPLAMRANVEHNHVLHEHVVIVTVDTSPIPRVGDSERIEIDPLVDTNDGIIHVHRTLRVHGIA